VNNAGIGVAGHALEGNPDEWDTMLNVNLHAPMRLTRLLAPAMAAAGHGVIINMGRCVRMCVCMCVCLCLCE
jgi:short-subunit dehydrogenase